MIVADVGAIALLGLSGLGGLIWMLIYARTTGSWYSLPMLLTAYFILVYNVSGIANVMNNHPKDQGYYSIAHETRPDVIGPALAVVGGLVLLCVVPTVHHRASRGTTEATFERARKCPWSLPYLLLIFGLTVIGGSLSAVLTMQRYAAAADLGRIISLDGGLARTAFLAGWFPWGVVIVATSLVQLTTRQPIALLALCLAAVGIVWSTAWSGGRTSALIYVLPVALIALPRLSRLSKLLGIGAGVFGYVLYSAAVTSARYENYTSTTISALGVLDWQLGRFSMVAWAQQYVNVHGLLYGETILSGAMEVPRAVAHFFGLDLAQNLRSITMITGQSILGDVSKQYVVPGQIAEWYINFGPLGVAVSLAMVAAGCVYLDRAIARSPEPVYAVFPAFLGSLLIFCSLSSQSGALGNYLFLSGLPMLIGLVLASGAGHRRGHGATTLVSSTTGLS